MDTSKNELVLICKKCDHHLYVQKPTLKKLGEIAETDCPGCGEEGLNLWVLSRRGNYDHEHG